MKIQVFKTGNHTDANGNSREWSESDLDNMVKLYNEQSEENKHRAPIVIGHPKTDDPAYGWVKSLTREGQYLYAEVEKLDKQFTEEVNKGKYGTVSISLYDNGLLKHIGFLGAMPPAVKGLEPVKFNSYSHAVLNYTHFAESEGKSDNSKNPIAKLWEWVRSTYGTPIGTAIEKKHIELSNVKAASKKEKQVSEDEDEEDEEFSEKPNKEPQMPDTEALAQIKALEARLTQKDKEFADLQKQLLETEFDKAFAEYVSQGKLVPAQKEFFRPIYIEFRNKQGFEFAEGDKKLSSKEYLDRFIGTMPKFDLFNEFASRGSDDKDDELAKEIEAYNKEKN